MNGAPRVVGAVVLRDGQLLLVSKRAAPEVFHLPGGKPEAGESELDCLTREIAEELGVEVAAATPYERLHAPAALEGMPTDLAVYLATLRGPPTPAAEIARLAWWPEHAVTLAPAIRDEVVPRLEASGRLARPDRVVVRRVAAAATLPLRAAMLRPGKDLSAVMQPGDDAPDTWFFAALTPEDSVLSTVNIRPGAPDFDAAGTGWWWLRGMVTAPDARRRGHARAVVTAALGHVDALGGGVWCNARVPAVGFYAKLGFEPIGDQWTVPLIGPHVRMVRWPGVSGACGRAGSEP